MDTQILNPPTSGWSPGAVKAMQPEKIKDQEDATNDTDQRISFFRAVKKYVSNNKGSFCEDLGIVLGSTLAATLFSACMIMVVSVCIPNMTPTIYLTAMGIGVASTLVAAFAVCSLAVLICRINDFFHSPEYLQTKGTKKLTENLKQLNKDELQAREKLQTLCKEQSENEYYTALRDQQHQIYNQNCLLREIRAQQNRLQYDERQVIEKLQTLCNEPPKGEYDTAAYYHQQNLIYNQQRLLESVNTRKKEIGLALKDLGAEV